MGWFRGDENPDVQEAYGASRTPIADINRKPQAAQKAIQDAQAGADDNGGGAQGSGWGIF